MFDFRTGRSSCSGRHGLSRLVSCNLGMEDMGVYGGLLHCKAIHHNSNFRNVAKFDVGPQYIHVLNWATDQWNNRTYLADIDSF